MYKYRGNEPHIGVTIVTVVYRCYFFMLVQFKIIVLYIKNMCIEPKIATSTVSEW